MMRKREPGTYRGSGIRHPGLLQPSFRCIQVEALVRKQFALFLDEDRVAREEHAKKKSY